MMKISPLFPHRMDAYGPSAQSTSKHCQFRIIIIGLPRPHSSSTRPAMNLPMLLSNGSLTMTCSVTFVLGKAPTVRFLQEIRNIILHVGLPAVLVLKYLLNAHFLLLLELPGFSTIMLLLATPCHSQPQFPLSLTDLFFHIFTNLTIDVNCQP